jgi:hypothetical protein
MKSIRTEDADDGTVDYNLGEFKPLTRDELRDLVRKSERPWFCRDDIEWYESELPLWRSEEPGPDLPFADLYRLRPVTFFNRNDPERYPNPPQPPEPDGFGQWGV